MMHLVIIILSISTIWASEENIAAKFVKYEDRMNDIDLEKLHLQLNEKQQSLCLACLVTLDNSKDLDITNIMNITN